jgi:predicted Ser/Thr protein kinase
MAKRPVDNPRAAAAAVQPGVTLGRYQIERQLGEGGMGRVFLAHDPTLRRKVAIKVLGWSATGETSRSRVLHEARSVATLNHPNICGIYEVGEDSGLAFIAMEYVEGRPLTVILVDGPLSIEDALRYGIEAAAALAHAHDQGVIHRDVKTANAIISSSGRLKIVDFGLARRTDSAMSDATTAATLAGPGVPAGTPYAMAPEQVRGGATDARTDAWALGVQQELEWLNARDPGAGLGVRAEQAARAGRLREARALAAKSADAYVRAGQPEAGAFRWLTLAETEAASGALGDARRDAVAALKLSTERDVMRYAARILAMSGAAEEARSMLARLLEEYPPTHTFAHAAYLPSIRAALALSEGDAKTAIVELEGADPYDAADYGLVYLTAAAAYLADNRAADAAAEFQKLLDQAHGSTTLSSVAQIGRARALGRSGDLAGSRRAYAAGIAAWRDSDADVPLHMPRCRSLPD